MSTGQLRPDYQTGACRVNGATGSFVFNDGAFTSVLRTGAGVWELGTRAAAATECAPSFQVLSDQILAASINTEFVSATLLRLRGLSVAGGAVALTDFDFDFELHRVHTATP